jgi:hypothetical protein
VQADQTQLDFTTQSVQDDQTKLDFSTQPVQDDQTQLYFTAQPVQDDQTNHYFTTQPVKYNQTKPEPKVCNDADNETIYLFDATNNDKFETGQASASNHPATEVCRPRLQSFIPEAAAGLPYSSGFLPEYKSPCWQTAAGVLHCLPYFYILVGGRAPCGLRFYNTPVRLCPIWVTLL